MPLISMMVIRRAMQRTSRSWSRRPYARAKPAWEKCCRARDNRPLGEQRPMWRDLLAIVPVGLVLGLLAFGRYGGRSTEPNRKTIALVGVAAILGGPVAMQLLGLGGWLLVVATVTAGFTAYAATRGGPRRPTAPQG